MSASRGLLTGAHLKTFATLSPIPGFRAWLDARLAKGEAELLLPEEQEALAAIARKAIDRKTGARGLRSIMESILLDTMFDLPSLEGVEEVVISREVVEGSARPLYIYADRSDRAGDAGGASA